ncbi:hypothetical protein [Streptomyces olivaceus]|uniref:hypothetical protein n=1 Tax=Streptomyces olivaceus TaxID=47716 RepID=UPI004055EE88
MAVRNGDDMPHIPLVIVLQPVLEVTTSTDLPLWPVAGIEPHGFLPLSGALAYAEVGTAVDEHRRPQRRPTGGRRPHDTPRGRGLLTMEELVASGDLRVTDTAPGITLLLPGYWLWSQEVKKPAEHYAES